MPGRHEKQRVKKKKTKRREALQPMEKMVKDSWIKRQNKETTILNELLPVERIEVKYATTAAANKITASATKKNPASLSANNNSSNNNVVTSVAATRKNLAESNWMSKNRYASKAQEKEFKNFVKEESKGKVDPNTLSNRHMKLMKAKYLRQTQQGAADSGDLSSGDKRKNAAKVSQDKAKTSAEKLLESLAGH